MKTWIVKMWRSNPQLKNGGYETTRKVEARTEASAWKKAQKIANDCLYGSMTILDVIKEV